MLEKCYNKKSVGFLFQDYEECKYYQAQYGGSIHSIQKIEDVSEVLERSPLGLDDDCDMVGPCTSVKFEHRGSPYFVLVLKAEKLNNKNNNKPKIKIGWSIAVKATELINN